MIIYNLYVKLERFIVEKQEKHMLNARDFYSFLLQATEQEIPLVKIVNDYFLVKDCIDNTVLNRVFTYANYSFKRDDIRYAKLNDKLNVSTVIGIDSEISKHIVYDYIHMDKIPYEYYKKVSDIIDTFNIKKKDDIFEAYSVKLSLGMLMKYLNYLVEVYFKLESTKDISLNGITIIFNE